jgi:hypothetical protein
MPFFHHLHFYFLSLQKSTNFSFSPFTHHICFFNIFIFQKNQKRNKKNFEKGKKRKCFFLFFFWLVGGAARGQV